MSNNVKGLAVSIVAFFLVVCVVASIYAAVILFSTLLSIGGCMVFALRILDEDP